MFITDGTNIKIPHGDSAKISFTFVCPDGETPYFLKEGQSVKLEIRPVKGADPIITKIGAEQSADGAVAFGFSPEETSVALGVYIYTVRIIDREGMVSDTWLGFPREALFAVGTDCAAAAGFSAEDSITVKVGQAEYPRYDGEYTVTPSFGQATVLETSGRLLTDDVTVEMIPVTETENEYGGITLGIGGQYVG